VKCAHCGKRYLGASANGNGGRYHYYVCFSRQRYGKKACEGERLPADQLEEAILDQLLAVLGREPMVREAISEAFAELDADQPKREAELERIGAERRRSSESLERYFRAFEEGTMPESTCAPRIGELSESCAGWRAGERSWPPKSPPSASRSPTRIWRCCRPRCGR
jgi:site-specific DNA recombinase